MSEWGKYGYCEECDDEFFDEDEGTWCTEPDCSAKLHEHCVSDHMDREHTKHIYCHECKKEIEIDPPCPICSVELCDDCLPNHTSDCKAKQSFEQHQLFLTQFDEFAINSGKPTSRKPT